MPRILDELASNFRTPSIGMYLSFGPVAPEITI
jgi:hypothetical protein